MRIQNYYLNIAPLGFALALFSAFVFVLSGLGTKWEFWNYRVGLKIFRWAAYGGIIAVLTLIAGYFAANHRMPQNKITFSIIGLLAGITVVSIALKWRYIARNVPPINDITTDTVNPPQFDKILEFRKDSSNPSQYRQKFGAQQHKFYPDIKSEFIEILSAQAFDLCLAKAKEMGWDIVAADVKKGIIEAVDETFWFGFKDDIVIRITPSDNHSIIDVRSESRVGKSDIGTNAKRIRKYLKKLKS